MATLADLCIVVTHDNCNAYLKNNAISTSTMHFEKNEFTNDDMKDVARFYARVLLNEEDTKRVRQDVQALKAERQIIRYCFNEDDLPGYPE